MDNTIKKYLVNKVHAVKDTVEDYYHIDWSDCLLIGWQLMSKHIKKIDMDIL